MQVPTISEINKISITQLQQEQHQQGATPQELQNALKILLDNLSTKQKGTLTQQQVDLLEHISPIIQKGLSPQQGKQITSLLPQLTKRAMGQSYNIFDPVNGAVNLGFRLASLSDSGKLKPADVLIGLGAIYFSSQTGLSPDVLYKFGKDLLSQLPSPTLATTQVSSTITPQKQPHPITKTDFGSPPPSVQDRIW